MLYEAFTQPEDVLYDLMAGQEPGYLGPNASFEHECSGWPWQQGRYAALFWIANHEGDIAQCTGIYGGDGEEG
jgi:hypothetical protein